MTKNSLIAMLPQIANWVVVSAAIIGTILNSSGKRIGFYFWMVSNVYLCVINYMDEFYAQSFLFFFYFFSCVYGLWKWKKQGDMA